MQGRYAVESSYEDFIIEGDYITHKYLAYSHYNREFAERNGYDYEEEDAVYEDRIVEWDYRNGVMKTEWMGDIIVDKNGNIRRDSSYYYLYYKTDQPRPDPIDPSTLNSTEGDAGTDITEEDEAFEEREESLEATEDAAQDAGVTGENDVEA